MKKTSKKYIGILIILIILIIVGLKAFMSSKANKQIEITANFSDLNKMANDEKTTILATNDGENGMEIILPEFANEKKVSKYIITKKDIINDETESTKTESTKTESAKTEDTKTESTKTESTKTESTKTESTKTESTKTESTKTESTKTESTKTENTKTESTKTENTKTESTKTESTKTESTKTESTKSESTETKNTNVEENQINNTVVEKLPGEKIYLTQEEIENKTINFEVIYDTIEIEGKIFYSKKVAYKDEDDYEVVAVLGYMPENTQINVTEIDVSGLEEEISRNYSNMLLVRKL